jgi:phage-related protein
MVLAGRDATVPRGGKRPLGNSADLMTKRTARVLLCVYREHLVALHGFIKKTRATPNEDLALARKRKKELEQ